MKIFKAIQTQWMSFYNAVSKYIGDVLGRENGNYGSSNIFGQIFTVLNGAVQNIMLYIEDAISEQSTLTAQRKRSIYSLARLSGYEPSLGTASSAAVSLTYIPSSATNMTSVIVPNHTKLQSSQNNLIYNIILPSESVVYELRTNNNIKHINIVEGTFNTYEHTATGGELYTFNVPYIGDIDVNYITLTVNGTAWSKADSLYDMVPNGEEYVLRSSLDEGFDVVFGNGQYGKPIAEGDVISIEYLSHNGEDGNILPNQDNEFTFITTLTGLDGSEVDGNSIFKVALEDRAGVTSGTYSETTDQVKEMIGYNSRSLVLADAKNYKIFFNRFSFVGYNRVWSENGSLVVNVLALKNYDQLCEEGNDYFSLDETDFNLSGSQIESIKSAIVSSGQQIGGTILNFITPVLKKYAIFIYLKMKSDVIYDEDTITMKVRNLLGEFFGKNITSDKYIPKSDIIHLLKENITELDGVNIYFISEANEDAKRLGSYTERTFVYNPGTMTYTSIDREVPVDGDPNLGFDDHGNIYLENDNYFPVLMGGWTYGDGNIMIYDPVHITFQE